MTTLMAFIVYSGFDVLTDRLQIESDASASVRLDIASVYLEEIFRSPVLGVVGRPVDDHTALGPLFRTELLERDGTYSHSHNHMLTELFQAGIVIGALPTLVRIWAVRRSAIQRDVGAFAVLLGSLTSLWAGSFGANPTYLFGVISSIALGAVVGAQGTSPVGAVVDRARRGMAVGANPNPPSALGSAS